MANTPPEQGNGGSTLLEFPSGISNTIHLALTPVQIVRDKSAGGDPAEAKVKAIMLGGAFFLPVPMNLSEAISNDFETVSDPSDILGAVATAIGINLTELTGIIGRKSMIESGMSNVNAEIAQLYKGSAPREFSWNWVFAPQNHKEADDLRKILFTMKFFNSPSIGAGTSITLTVDKVMEFIAKLGVRAAELLSGQHINEQHVSSRFLGYPSAWDIQLKFVTNGKSMKIMHVQRCVCTAMNITYSDEDFLVYRDGMPKKISVSCTFREMSFFTRDKLAPDALLG